MIEKFAELFHVGQYTPVQQPQQVQLISVEPSTVAQPIFEAQAPLSHVLYSEPKPAEIYSSRKYILTIYFQFFLAFIKKKPTMVLVWLKS